MSKNQRTDGPVLDATSLNALSQSIKSREPAVERKEAMRSRILSRLKDVPPPVGTRTVRADEGEWIVVSPLLEVKILRRDLAQHNQTTLWRLKPGAVIAAHSHSQEEECWVLEGEIKIGDHYVCQGDMHIAQPGYDHPPIECERGALLLVRAEIGDGLMV